MSFGEHHNQELALADIKQTVY